MGQSSPPPDGADRHAWAAYVEMLFGAEPEGAYVELRLRRSGEMGMRRAFLEVKPAVELLRRVEAIGAAEGPQGDVYIGVAPRARQAGTRAAIERAHVLWADVDGPEALAKLRNFRPRPSMVVCSGSPDSVHAYWALQIPGLAADALERANRRLAHAIGADPKCVDAPRILRLPGTFNHKGRVPTPVTVAYASGRVYAPADVVGSLPDPPARRARGESRAAYPLPPLDPSDLRSQAVAVRLIQRFAPDAELRAGNDGRLRGRCPFPHHLDRNPSFCVHPDGAWVCSCGSGDVIRLFVELRGEFWLDRELPHYERELRQELGLSDGASQGDRRPLARTGR